MGSDISKTYYTLQIASASASLFASSLITAGILKTDKGLSSSYRRIVFGLSISDICQSFALAVGPFSVPSGTPTGRWGQGNRSTCQFNGFILNCAGGATSMYMFALCLYTVLKIRRNIPDAFFARKIEKKIHIMIFICNFCIGIFGLATKAINSGAMGNVCAFAAFPTGCRQKPEIFGQCDVEIDKYVPILVYINSIGIPFFCLGGIMCCMSIICWHTLVTRRSTSSGAATRSSPPPLPKLKNQPSFFPPMEKSFAPQEKQKANVSDDIIAEEYLNRGHQYDFENQEERNVKNNGDVEDEVSALQGSNPDFPNIQTANLDLPTIRLSLRKTPENQPICLQEDCALSELTLNGRNEKKTGCQQHQNPSIMQEAKRVSSNDTSEEPATSNQQNECHLHHTQMLIRLYRREIVLQACYFVLGFFITFVFYWVLQVNLVVQKSPPSTFVILATCVLYPLGGFFNILVYTRPKIISFRMKRPGEYSWLRAFWHVVMAGGDSPEENKRNALAIPGIDADERSVAFGAEESVEVVEAKEMMRLQSLACLYDGSIGFESGNIAYRSPDKWPQNTGERTSRGCMPQGDCNAEESNFVGNVNTENAVNGEENDSEGSHEMRVGFRRKFFFMKYMRKR